MDEPGTPPACTHEDLERVGAEEVTCLACGRVAWIFDIIDRGIHADSAWRPL